MKIKNWQAYCKTCHKELENCPNEYLAEAVARWHKTMNPLHQIIVGYEQEDSID